MRGPGVGCGYDRDDDVNGDCDGNGGGGNGNSDGGGDVGDNDDNMTGPIRKGGFRGRRGNRRAARAVKRCSEGRARKAPRASRGVWIITVYQMYIFVKADSLLFFNILIQTGYLLLEGSSF